MYFYMRRIAEPYLLLGIYFDCISKIPVLTEINQNVYSIDMFVNCYRYEDIICLRFMLRSKNVIQLWTCMFTIYVFMLLYSSHNKNKIR